MATSPTEKYTEEDLDYYIHSFRKDVETGDSAVIHCTRCEELLDMLVDLKHLRAQHRESLDPTKKGE